MPRPPGLKSTIPAARGLDAALYEGRGQTYAKHVILRNYVEELAFKVLQARKSNPRFTYVDGFAGPWRNQSDDFADTSFGIVLPLLTSVVTKLKQGGMKPAVRAIFVEESPAAFARLRAAVAAYPEVEVTALLGRFEDRVTEIQRTIGDGFLFTFLDPTGWTGMALDKVGSLLRHPHGEVMVNLMTYAIVRHMDHGPVRDGFDGLFGGSGWRQQFDALLAQGFDREEAARQIYLDRLRTVCRFPFVTTTRIRDPAAARTYFHLAYGTRHHKGVEVFRAAEKRCLPLQEQIAASAFHERRATRVGMPDLFADDDGGIAAFQQWRAASLTRARQAFDRWLDGDNPQPAAIVAANIMQHPYVDLPIIRTWADQAKRDGRMKQQTLPSGKILWTPAGLPR